MPDLGGHLSNGCHAGDDEVRASCASSLDLSLSSPIGDGDVVFTDIEMDVLTCSVNAGAENQGHPLMLKQSP